MTIRIGTSGWSYPHFRGAFYPRGLPAHRELEYASRAFDSLEINRSFYSLLSPEVFRAWAAETPARFVFALKGSSFITHSKKLRDVEVPLGNFFASGPLVLGAKLGPIVWQLPERLAFDHARLSEFFALLPRTTFAAAELARKHDGRVKHGVFMEPARNRRLRHAIEPRHESFRATAFAELARAHRVALAVADSASWPSFDEVTADFVYARLHGRRATYRSRYSTAELARWAQRIRGWAARPDGKGSRTRDVYVYFDNDADAHAAANARELGGLLGTPSAAPHVLA